LANPVLKICPDIIGRGEPDPVDVLLIADGKIASTVRIEIE
jgi:hypothetical protein